MPLTSDDLTLAGRTSGAVAWALARAVAFLKGREGALAITPVVAIIVVISFASVCRCVVRRLAPPSLFSLSRLRKYPRRFFAFWTRNLIVNQSAISTLLSNSAFSTLAHVIDVNRDPPASWPGERIASTSKRVGVWAQREGRESSRSRSRARKARGLRAQPVRAE